MPNICNTDFAGVTIQTERFSTQISCRSFAVAHTKNVTGTLKPSQKTPQLRLGGVLKRCINAKKAAS